MKIIIPVLYLLKLSDVSLFKSSKIIFNYFLLSIPFILAIFFVQYGLSVNSQELVVFTFILTILYYFIAVKNDPEMIVLFKNVTSQIPVIGRFVN